MVTDTKCGKLALAWAIVLLLTGIFGVSSAVWAQATPMIQKPVAKMRFMRHTVHPLWRSTKLGKILVVGQRIQIPAPIVFEIIKAGLGRPWSSAPRDRNLVVCRFRYKLGSHLKDRAVLFCQTNNEHFQFQARHPYYRRFIGGTTATFSGPLTFEEFQTDQMHLVDPNRLRRLMAKLPPVESRYELEVTHHGHPVSEWFMNQGQLVKVVYIKKRPVSPAGIPPRSRRPAL